MPLPDHVIAGNRRSLRGFFTRMGSRHHAVADEPVAAPPATGPDAATRRFWATDSDVRGPHNESRDRVAALVHAHEHGTAGPRPRGNPAFSETLFVELMRARQFRRAFDHLSDECRARWGSAEAFAAAQGSAMRRLLGVTVKDVRYLPQWFDANAGRVYEEVAELDVEYALAAGDHPQVLRRVVHLVPGAGKWRSVCYPG